MPTTSSATPPPSLTSRDKLVEIIRALVALTHAVPGVNAADVYAWSPDFVRLTCATHEALVSLSALLDARIETVGLGNWEIGLCKVGETSVEISGPHRDKVQMPEPQPVEIDSDAALAMAAEAVRA